jgi:hypothetical protein
MKSLQVMQKERSMSDSDFEKKRQPDQRYDPVVAAWADSQPVTKAILKNGESLTPIPEGRNYSDFPVPGWDWGSRRLRCCERVIEVLPFQ